MDRTLKIALIVLGVVTALLLAGIVGFGVYNSLNMRPDASTATSKSDFTEYKQAIANKQSEVSGAPSTNYRPPQAAKDLRKEREIYSKLKALCDSWSDRYKKSRNELSRVNMNDACRQAKNYAKNELHFNTRANYASWQPQKVTPTYRQPVVSSYKSSNNNQCARWERELKNIQSQLRAGYNEPRGNYLRAKRREVNELIRENC